MFKDQYEESSNVILDNSYVDDILFAVSSKFQAEKKMWEKLTQFSKQVVFTSNNGSCPGDK